MVFFLLNFLSVHFSLKIPAVFMYASTRMILAAMTTLVLTICIGQRFICILYSLKTGQTIRVEDCPTLISRHMKKKEIPSMGGILMVISLLISLFLWMDLQSSYTLIFFITTLFFGLVGGFDDFLKIKFKNSKGLSSKKKFFFQFFFSLILGIYLLFPSIQSCIEVGNWFTSLKVNHAMYFLPFKKDPIFTFSGVFVVIALIITIFVITGASNAVNLTDGLDGLASGCVILVACVLAIFAFLSNNKELSAYLNIAYIEGGSEIAVYMCALAGTCLGFLWYNGYPAEVFMGDIGSITLGAILGVASVLLRRELLLALIGAVFVGEALSVIVQVASYKFRNKKRIFLCSPLHHHFEFKGWEEQKIVTRFWIVGLIFSLIGLASLKFQ